MSKRNKMKRLLVALVSLCLFFAVWQFISTGRAEELMQSDSGIPDAVSSMSDGTFCRLTVVANASSIEDRTEFAYEVAQKCRENSFRTIRFSTDRGGLPSDLEITVYLRRSDIGSKEPVMRMRMERVPGGYKLSVDGADIGEI